MKKKIDLPPAVVTELSDIFSSWPEIEKVTVFGSRVLGNAKPGSDVDIAIYGSSVTSAFVGAVQVYLEEETNLPWFFDCIHFESITNEALREHIRKYGITLYRKKV